MGKKLPSMAFAIEAIKKKIITLVTLHIMCGNINKNKFKRVVSSKEKKSANILDNKDFPERKRYYSVRRKWAKDVNRGHRRSAETSKAGYVTHNKNNKIKQRK